MTTTIFASNSHDDSLLIADLLAKHSVAIASVQEIIKADAIGKELCNKGEHSKRYDDIWILRFVLSHKSNAKAAAKAALETMKLEEKELDEVGDFRLTKYRPPGIPMPENKNDVMITNVAIDPDLPGMNQFKTYCEKDAIINFLLENNRRILKVDPDRIVTETQTSKEELSECYIFHNGSSYQVVDEITASTRPEDNLQTVGGVGSTSTRLFQSIASGVKETGRPVGITRTMTRTYSQTHKRRNSMDINSNPDYGLSSVSVSRSPTGTTCSSRSTSSIDDKMDHHHYRKDVHTQDEAHALENMEYILRHVTIAMAIYLLGAYHQKMGGLWISEEKVWDFAKIFGIAWGTCVTIKVMDYGRASTDSELGKDGADISSLLSDHLLADKNNNAKHDEDEMKQGQPVGNRESEHEQASVPQEHLELEQLYIFNHLTGERVRPNSPPEEFENEFVKMKVLIMIRTSDADVKTEGMGNVTRGTASNDAISNYIRPKKRRFEIQMQMKFKKKPDKLWFSAYVEDQVKMGPMQKLFVRAALRFAEMKNSGQVHANPTGTMMETEEGGEDDAAAAGNNYAGNPNFEAPHYGISFDKAFDVIVETKEGDEYESNLPKLGAEVSEDPEAMKKRKKDGMVFNTTSTYTVCCWSAYADFLKWKIVNLPAIRPFSIDGALGDSPLNISIYSLKEDKIGNEKADHRNGNLLRISDMEIGNATKCRTSRLHRKWQASLQRAQNNDSQQSSTVSNDLEWC
mmetsp:Transcript_15328/g.22320  ORF Transcript_15328/g.22320 Transcript_15328/m.22320 type:complete len:743 (-) Transcript_15328:78-2306(-)